MFKRFRQLEISLAAKCQLLFGAAVILIIAAALFVPWQRMEQLMEQMNQRTAKTLAEWAVLNHVAEQTARLGTTEKPPVARPPIRAPVSARPTTNPTDAAVGERTVVRLLLLAPDPHGLPRFETKAMEQYREDPSADPIKGIQRGRDGATSFRYARPLYAQPNCIQCHDADIRAARALTAKRQGKGVAPLLGLVSVEIPYVADANQLFLNRVLIFLAGLIAGTLAIIVFYLITTRLILGPVRVLQDTAEKVSQGDLNIRSDISTGDEFQQLSETFNRMLTHLQESEDQLRTINKSLDMKLGQLAESNLALYESNRLKSEFLANVSHELRTPLNSILGFAELLKDSAGAEARNARYIQNITNSGKNLLDLINDLLDLAKIEAGRMEVRSEPMSVSDLFEGLITIIKPLAEKKDLSIEATVARDVPILQSDPAKLQQVLYNFLSNAIKFSPAGGQIELRCQRLGEDQVRIEVADQGPGIDPSKHAQIFEKFRQLDASVTREHGGTGLGLSISKELTNLMGGTIGVSSRRGEGATFWVILPVKTQAGQQTVQVMYQNQ